MAAAGFDLYPFFVETTSGIIDYSAAIMCFTPPEAARFRLLLKRSW